MELSNRTAATNPLLTTLALAGLWLAGAGGGFAAEAAAEPVKPPAVAADESVVLDHTTMWRFFRVRDAAHVRHTNGVLARAALSWSGHEWPPTEWDARGTSPTPPADWAGPEFDDSRWPRERLPQPSPPAWNVPNQSGNTGSINLFDTVAVLLRAKFTVKDPTQVKACRLSLDYWGGFIVHVNGRETLRRNILPGSTNLLGTVAEDYPVEAWTSPEGKPIVNQDIDKFPERMAQRDRRQRNLEMPVGHLRAGHNVVAIELHMGPIDHRALAAYWRRWAPIGLFTARLSVSPGAAAAPARAAQVHVWNCDAYDTQSVFDYGDPTIPVQPIRVNAARNSVFNGRLMVSSDQPIKGLKVRVSDLDLAPGSGAGASTIAASAIRVRYAVPATPDKSWAAPHRFDGLLDPIPAEIPASKVSAPARELFSLRPYMLDSNVAPGVLTGGAVAPLWFTVRVPKTAAPGLYEGVVTVSADGLTPTDVKLTVNVCDWVMPDPKDFRIQNFLYNAEEVAAMHYGVTNYSDKHFELVGKSLALLAEANSRQVHANLSVGFKGRGNPESLVRWIQQPDGSFKHDFTNFDKCLAMVAKSIGTPNTLRLNLWGGPVTVVDPATGKLANLQPPVGEEGYRFWKPVFDEMLKKIKARGWLEQTTIGCNIHSGVPSPAQVDFAHRLWPEGEWSWTSHAAGEGARFAGTMGGAVKEEGNTGGRAHRVSTGDFSGVDTNTIVLMTVRHADGVWMVGPSGKLPPLWALDGPRRNTYCNTVRHVVTDNCALREVRRLVEFGALYRGYDGVSEFGADVFPVKRPVGGYGMPPISEGANWGSPNSTLSLLYPGPDGPVTTERFEMFREGVELCEAIIFVRGAIHRNRIGQELKAKAEGYLGQRQSVFAMGFFMPRYRQITEDAKLLELAGEVARELEGKK